MIQKKRQWEQSPLQPEDDVLCHCCLNYLPQNMFPYSAEVAQILSSTVVLEPVSVDVSQGQNPAQGKVSSSLVPTDLAPQQHFRPGHKKE